MSAIDAHVHVIVPELLRRPGASEDWRPRVRRDGETRELEYGGHTISSVVHEFVEIDEILGVHRDRGVDHVVLCPWVPLLFAEIPVEEALPRLAIQNEALAAMREAHPGRISVLGAVPLQDPALAAAMLEELVGSGAFAGVEVPASVAGRYPGDPRFEPFWEAAEASGALVFVHPTTRGFDAPVFAEHYLWNLVGNPFETTIAAAHLVMSGVIERHPGLRVLLAHGGGAIVALRGRLAHGQEAVAAAGEAVRRPVDLAIGRLMFDTVTHDPALLRDLVGAVGASQLLLGSDYPFDMGDPHPVETVRSAALGEEAEQAVLRGNAERLLGLDAKLPR